MKQEMLRCLHFGENETPEHRAFDISFHLFRKEILGVLGLSEYEKDAFLSWISGERRQKDRKFSLLLRDEFFVPQSPKQILAEGIFIIRHGISAFLSMSILENIMVLPGKPGHAHGFGKLKLPENIQILMDRFLPGISARTNLVQLTEYQRYIVELMKAVYFQAEIIIMDVMLDGFHQKDRDLFWSLLYLLKEEGKSFIIFFRNLEEGWENCDRLSVFRHGNGAHTFVKKDFCRKEVIRCLQNSNSKFQRKFKNRREQGEVFLKVKEMILSDDHDSNYSFLLRKGRVTGFIDMEHYRFLDLADALFGIREHSQKILEIKGKRCQLKSPGEAVKEKIFLFHSPADQDHSFQMLNFQENLMLPWERTSAYPGGFLRKKFINREYRDFLNLTSYPDLEEIFTNRDKLYLLFSWIDLMGMELIIFKNPTKGLNFRDTEFVCAQIHRLAEEGRAVALITPDVSEIETCCDGCYYIREGKIDEYRSL